MEIESRNETNRLTELQNSRDEKFKDLGKQLKDTDSLLDDKKSMLKYQPGIYLTCNKCENMDELRETFRMLEKFNSREDGEIIGKNREKTIEAFDKYFVKFCEYSRLEKGEPRSTVIEAKKEFCDFLETTRNFCYLEQPKSLRWINDLLSSFKDTKIQKLYTYYGGKDLINTWKELSKEYDLNKDEKIHLLINTMFSNELSGFLQTLSSKEVRNEIENLKNSDIESRKLIEELFINKIRGRFETDDIVKNIEQSGLEMDQNKINDNLKWLIDNEFSYSAATLIGRIETAKLITNGKIYQTELYQDPTKASGEGHETIISDAFEKVVLNLNVDPAKSVLLLNKWWKIENGIPENYKEITELLGQVKSIISMSEDYRTTAEMELFSSTIVPCQFVDFISKKQDYDVMAIMGATMPLTLKYFNDICEDKELFTEKYFDFGGSLEDYDKYIG